MTDARRGFVPEDSTEFNKESQNTLLIAQKDLLYLLNSGYPIKTASTFVGNHYLLSERQRLAIVRASAEKAVICMREEKRLTKDTLGRRVHIDGLNLIITLEVALSEGTLIRCMDQTIRDLAGLRGTYRPIDRTDAAILLTGDALNRLKVEEACFYLDAPVSNTGRLKLRILELLQAYPFAVTVELVDNADVILEKLDNVVTSDAIILNRCLNWFNMAEYIISEKLPRLTIVDLSRNTK